jgi:hypothetical protein
MYSLNRDGHYNRQLQFIFNKRADSLQFTVEKVVSSMGELLNVEQLYLDKLCCECLCINVSHDATRPPSYNELSEEARVRATAKTKQTKLDRYGQTGVINTVDSIARSAETRRGIRRPAAISEKMIETKKKNNTLYVPHPKLKGRKNAGHSNHMKLIYREGRLSGLDRSQAGASNGNCKDRVTMKCLDTGEVYSLYRFEWKTHHGINASKMSRITHYKQKTVNDKHNNQWQLT